VVWLWTDFESLAGECGEFDRDVTRVERLWHSGLVHLLDHLRLLLLLLLLLHGRHLHLELLLLLVVLLVLLTAAAAPRVRPHDRHRQAEGGHDEGEVKEGSVAVAESARWVACGARSGGSKGMVTGHFDWRNWMLVRMQIPDDIKTKLWFD
jgi:hypothetical protein